MVKADLDTADGKTFVGQNHGLAGTIGEVGANEVREEAKESIASCAHFLDLFDEGHGFSTTGERKTSTGAEVPLSLQSLFGPGGLTGFIQELSVAFRGMAAPTQMRVDNDPGYLEVRRREEDLKKEIEKIEVKARVAGLEERLAELKEARTVTGQKRPASATVVVVQTDTKRGRLVRSTGESDARKLGILREMHALYVLEVEKMCIMPNLTVLPNKVREKLVGNDPQKELKVRFRRATNHRILCVPAVRGFLGGFNSELCDKFDEAFGGDGDNIKSLISRVGKNKELPAFVWRNAVLSKCGKTECEYCE